MHRRLEHTAIYVTPARRPPLYRYINSRVATYDSNGDRVMSWGGPGTGLGQFVIPRSISIDRNDNVLRCRSHARAQKLILNP